jgi:hypothetical protein
MASSMELLRSSARGVDVDADHMRPVAEPKTGQRATAGLQDSRFRLLRHECVDEALDRLNNVRDGSEYSGGVRCPRGLLAGPSC